MEGYHHISPPAGEDDSEGAMRVFEGFLVIYKPALLRSEYYLEQIIQQLDPSYAEAYKPWHKALHDLFHGVHLISQHKPLSDPDAFLEAVRIFSFDSAIKFLRDICISCKMALQNDWEEHFREDINLLLQSTSILGRNHALNV